MSTLCRLSEDERDVLETYHRVLEAIPALEEQVRYMVENHSSGLIDLATYVRS